MKSALILPPLGLTLLSLAACYSPRLGTRLAESEGDPKIALELTRSDEAKPRQYFDFIPARQEVYCPPNSFANGLSHTGSSFFCLAGNLYEQQASQSFNIGAEATLICPPQTAAIAFKNDKTGKLQQIRCHKLPEKAGKDREDSVVNSGKEPSSFCALGSYLKGAQLAEDGSVRGLICGKTTNNVFKGLNANEINNEPLNTALASTLQKAKKIELRSKYLSMSGSYYIFVDSKQLAQQVAIAEGEHFNFGFEYKLLDLQERLYLKIKEKENSSPYLSTYTIFSVKDGALKKTSKIKEEELIPQSYFQIPNDATSLHFKWYGHPETLLASIEEKRQENSSDPKVFEVLNPQGEKIYYIRQQTHLLRKVFIVEKRAASSISMAEMLLATIILDRSMSRNPSMTTP